MDAFTVCSMLAGLVAEVLLLAALIVAVVESTETRLGCGALVHTPDVALPLSWIFSFGSCTTESLLGSEYAGRWLPGY